MTGGGVTPTGSVEFVDNGSPISGCTAQLLSSGIATCTTSFTDAAIDTLTAQYGGDGTYSGSTSNAVPQVVNQAGTSVALSSSANPSVTGQPVTYTATVTRTAPATGSAGGSISFLDGVTSISGCASVPLSSGVATCAVTYSATGTHDIMALYTPDVNDAESAPATLTQVVGKASTTTTVSTSPDPSTQGQAVTITVTVKAVAPGEGNPTGSVTISSDGVALGTVTLDPTLDSQASLTTSSLSVGMHSITATYAGDANFLGSSSVAAATQTVLAPVPIPVTGPAGTALALALGLLVLGLIVVAMAGLRRREI